MTNRENNLPELPQGWVWTRVGEILEFQYGKALRQDRRDTNGTVPVYGSNGLIGHHYTALTDKACLIIGRKGAIGAVHLSKSPGWPIDTTYYAYPPNDVDLYFLYYLLSTSNLESLDKSTAIPGLNRHDAYALVIPLAPLPEQQHIVAKIEELLTRLDAGVEALKKVKAQVKAYRQAVLKHAFEGNLTAEWREAHKGELEPASVLLERIKAEHQKNAKGKFKELSPVDISDLPELPEGWMYLTLDYLAGQDKNSIKRGPFGSAIKKSFFVPCGYKVYEQGNVIYNDFKRGNYFIDDRKFKEMRGFETKSGDVLMSCSGTVGKIAIVPAGIQPGIINQALLKITPDNKVVNTPYFVYLFRSKIDEIILQNTRGSAMVNISSVKDLRQIPLAIPPLAEQHKIVEEIERHFSVADEVEKTVAQSLKQADRLRQSILKRAFEGKLVSQDPTDEPAEKLLERIKAERAGKETVTKPRRRTPEE